MTDTLIQAYLPLIVWSGLGLVLLRFLPSDLPRLLGRGLYWIGIPVEIFALARQTNLASQVGLTPLIAIAALLLGLMLSWLSLQSLNRLPAQWIAGSTVEHWQDRSRRGSYILCSMLGNTGFVGLAIVPTLIDERYLSWVVFYSVTQNVIGTYGIGILIASYFGRSQQAQFSWVQVRDMVTVPSLWAFIVGSLTRPVPLPAIVEAGLHSSILVVIPTALLLMGMRLSQMRGWQSLKQGIFPSVIKTLILPLLIGLIALALKLPPDARLAMVLMSGMPTAFAGLILAEEYTLDRELIASSIVLTTVMLLLTIPLWLIIFGEP